ncbi:unnamed protein product [Prorocentrum cordatum]|uniref:C2 domain-containing protein n=1 Tax=Prorocentrum cordatum TaxID=2364126 RepID=A0ABN9SDN0_9DINO|nr:unnamed protein product [Polarella glacialis]
MGLVLARREDEQNEYNQFLDKCRPEYIENDELLGLAPEGGDRKDDHVDLGREQHFDPEDDHSASDEDSEDGDRQAAPQLQPTAPSAKVDARTRAQGRIADQQRQLLQSAATGRKWKAMQLSRKPHIKVNFADVHGRTALFLAAERGQPSVCEMLLGGNATLRAKVDKTNNDGWTPLAAAVFHGQVACIEVLLNAAANVNAQDKHGCTPLILAASSPKLYLVDLVSRPDRRKREKVRREAFRLQNRLEKGIGAGQTGDQEDDLPAGQGRLANGMDPFTIWRYYPNRIELIVMDRLMAKSRLQVDLTDKWRRTPLTYAARYGRVHAVSRLLYRKANIHHKDKDGKTAVHHAACNDHLDTVELLLAAGSSVNSTDEYFRTPLHGALDAKDESMANLLLKADASVNAYDCEGRTPIMLAMDQQNQRLFGAIIEHRSNLDVLDRRGWNVVIYSIETGMFGEVFGLLSKLGERSKPVLRSRDPQGRNCLHHAAQLHDAAYSNKVVDQLLNMDHAAATLGDCNGDTAIHFSAELGRLEALRMYVSFHERVDFLNNRGETPLHYAAHGGHIACVVFLIENRGKGPVCDAYAIDKEGKTLLMHACVSGNLDLVNVLVQNKDGKHSVLALPPLDVNVRDCYGLTALSIAAQEGHWQLLPSLMLAGASTATKDFDGFTALHWAAVEDEALAASCLIDLGLDPNATDDRGWTPLMHAAARGSDEVARVLVDSGARLDVRNWDGDTATQICARRQDSVEAAQVTKDILADAMLDVGVKPSGCISAEGHFKVSVIRAEDLYLEGKVGELNVYVCCIFCTQDGSAPQVAFSSCSMNDSHPEWHEVFRFDTEKLDSSACLVAWVMAAPGTTAEDVVDSATLGLDEQELHRIRMNERITGKQRVRKRAGFGTSLQESFGRMMRQADKDQDEEVQKLRKLALAQRRDAEPTSDLKTATESERDFLPLEQRRWLEVNNLRALLQRSGCNVAPPLAPKCHLPLGCVVVRYRHLRQAVWGVEPVEINRTLRLNCRGSLKLEVDFRPKFFECKVEEKTAFKEDAGDDDVYDLRPLTGLSPEQLHELDMAEVDDFRPQQMETGGKAVTVDDVLMELANHGKPRRDAEELWKRFRQVRQWSQTVLEVKAQVAAEEEPLPPPKNREKAKDPADGASASAAARGARDKDQDKEAKTEAESETPYVVKAVKQAMLRYQAARQAAELRREALDLPIGSAARGVVAAGLHAVTAASAVQPGARGGAAAAPRLQLGGAQQAKEKPLGMRLPSLDPEPWLERLLEGSRLWA